MFGRQRATTGAAILAAYLFALLFVVQAVTAQANTTSNDSNSANQSTLTMVNDRLYTPQNTPLTVRLHVAGGARPYTYMFPETVVGGQLHGDGPLLTFTPEPDFSGRVRVNYEVSDAYGFTASARLIIDVGGPLLPNQRYISTDFETPTTIFGMMRGGQLPYTLNVDPTYTDRVMRLSDGAVLYTPLDDFVGIDRFNLRITDATGAQVETTVVVHVDANRAAVQPIRPPQRITPQAVDTAINTGVTIGLASTGQSPHARYQIVSPPLNGTVLRVRADRLLYVPATDFSGEDTFTYAVVGPNGQSTNATVRVRVGDMALERAQAVRLDATTGQNTLTWTASADAQHAVIERQQDDGPWLEIARVPATLGAYVDSATLCGTSHRYRVIMARQSGLAAEPVTPPTQATPPCITVDMRATQFNETIRLVWSGNVGGNAEVVIERREGSSSVWQPLTTLPAEIEAFTDTDVVCGGAYQYRATLAGTASQPSSVTVVCPPAMTSPGDQTHGIGEQVELAVQVENAPVDGLTFTAVDLPLGLRVDAETGVISGVVAEAAQTEAAYNTRLNIMMDGEVVASVAFNWTITDSRIVTPTNLQISGALTIAPVQPTFRWTHTPLTDTDLIDDMQYRLFVYQGQREVINSWYAAADICVGEVCSVQPQVFAGLLNGEYQWWVQAFDGDESVWSNRDGARFVVSVPAPAEPILLAPAGDIQSALTTFTWQRDLNALWYRLMVDSVIDEWVAAVDACEARTCSIARTLEGGIYTWDLVAWGPGGQQRVSADVDTTFVVQIVYPQPPQAITVNANQGRPTISWQADPNALWYHLYIGRDDGLPFDEWYEGQLICGDDGRCSTMPDIDWTSGTYAIWMQAWGPNGFSSGDGENTLESWVPGPDLVLPDIAAGVPTGLAATAADDTLAVNWVSGPYTTWYQLHILTADGAEAFTRWYRAEDSGCARPGQICTITTDATVLQSLQAGETYTLTVRGWGPGGFSDPAEITYTQ